ncbi:MAG TPA: site-2 protease family protein, partial [Fimbriimonadaceae bacterium]|nr:site-2 protease family protein [Fimbriimonadaceae bacterium]
MFFAIGLHEYSHCFFADMAGDPTPSYYGRLTLNLFRHFDALGTLAIIISSLTGFGLGWGKPAPITPSKMRNPRWDTFITVAAGPLSNLLQAVVYAFLMRIALAAGSISTTQVAYAF